MLKPLALTLLIATFLAAGFTLAPAEQASLSLNRTETVTAENLTVIPMDSEDEELVTTQKNKTDREDIPKT